MLLERQVKYIGDIVVISDTENLGVPRKEVIKVMSDIGQELLYVQAENHLDYLIQEKQLQNMKRHGRVIKSQTITTKRSYIYVSQQYRWHMMIEAE